PRCNRRSFPMHAEPQTSRKHIGRSVPRLENEALLRGRGRFMDDLPVRSDTLHAAILRSPHPHARIISIDTSAALSHPHVLAVLTGADMKAHIAPMKAPVDTPMEFYGVAV